MINEDFITEGADILVMVAIVPANIGGGSNIGGDKAGHGEWKRLC